MQTQSLYDRKNVFSHSGGEIGFSEKMGILRDVLDEEFRQMALSVDAKEEFYPCCFKENHWKRQDI